MRHKSETPLAWFTLVATTTHFVLETWYHFTWGQPLQALIVDYICNLLMVFGAVISLRVRPDRSAAGLLAAGWAFALGFGWRSLFGRLEVISNGKAFENGEAPFVVWIIGFALAIVILVLCWTLALAFRQAKGDMGGGAEGQAK